MKSESLDQLPALELGIRAKTEEGLTQARSILRNILFLESGSTAEGSTADALTALAATKRPSDAIFVFLRCLRVPGLVPSGGSASTSHRSVCDIVERSAPNIVKFFSVDTKDQTYKKYGHYETLHDDICTRLQPLGRNYVGLETLSSARGDIMNALNHGIVRTYCEPFGISEIRAAADAIISKSQKVLSESASLTSDIEECRNTISSARTLRESNGSFLFFDFLQPIICSAEAALDSFVSSTKGRFLTEILGSSSQLEPLQKKYPLHEGGRDLEVRIPLRNSGPGIALDVSVTTVSDSAEIAVSSQPVQLGDVMPGEFSVSVPALVITPTPTFRGTILVEWGEMARTGRRTEMFSFEAKAQRADINWDSLEFWHPYSTDPAEGEAFIGRNDLVRSLSSRLIRTPMESFYITGQKRVGKTSLARACTDYAKSKDANIETIEIIWGEIASEDARASLRALGVQIEEFMLRSVPSGFTYTKADYEGTLAPLVRLANLLREIRPDTKFVITIDEFDEIHQELYLFGNLAETFFANIRAFSGAKNIALILVGGENMPFVMDRQGQKLNRFTGHSLNYFSRSTEWSDYQELVRNPSTPHLEWHDDGVAEVFNITNGNPYFTNIVCAAAARAAYDARDSDITSREVSDAAAIRMSSLGTNAFVHLWQDGIFKPIEEREPDVLRRSRVLVAMARALRAGDPLTLPCIANSKGPSRLLDSDIEPTLNEFIQREVVSEDGGVYRFQLPLFQKWLMDVGYGKLIADHLSEELAELVRNDEEAARVKSAEVVELAQSWPPFRGQAIAPDDIRAWFEQVEGHRDQRLLFEILKNTRVFSEADIRSRLRTVYSGLKQALPEFVMQKLSDRRRDVVVTYLDGEGKSGQYYAGLFAEENRLSVDCIVPRSTFPAGIKRHIEKYGEPYALVVIDDIAATGGTLSAKVQEFCGENQEILRTSEVQLLIACLVGTKEADRRIRKALAGLDGIKADFRLGEVLGPDAYAFDAANSHWPTDELRERAKSLCQDLGSHIEKRNPLGHEGQGLLIVFPNTTPNNSLPILRTASKSATRPWKAIFPRVAN